MRIAKPEVRACWIAVPSPSAVAFAACIAIVGLRGPNARAGSELAQMSLPELRAALDTQLQTIRSMRAKYTVSYEPAGDGRAWGPDEFEWAQDGERRFLARSPAGAGVGSRPRIVTFDGSRGYSYRVLTPALSPGGTPRGEPIAVLALTDAANPALGMAFAPDMPLGARHALLRERVTTLMGLPGARLAKRDESTPGNQYNIEIDGVLSVANAPLRVLLTLDAEHDFLPLRVAVYYEKGSPNAKYYMIWDVRAFMRVRDGQTNAERWFPRSATYTQVGGMHRLEVTEATVNLDIPVETFQPRAAPGETVVDGTAEGQGRRYVVGGRRNADELVRHAADLAKSEIQRGPRTGPEIPDTSRVLDARPRRSYSASRIALYVSLGLGIAGAGAWLVSLRR